VSNRALPQVLALHLGVLGLLFLAQFVLPPYHHTNVARILVLAVYALGFLTQSAFTGLAQTLAYLSPSLLVWWGLDRDATMGSQIRTDKSACIV